MFEDVTRVLKGLPFVLVGGAVYIGSDAYLPEKIKPLGKIAGMGAAGYGLYKMFVEKPPEYETPEEGEWYPVIITDPSAGEEWSCLRPHTVNCTITNPYNKHVVLYAIPLYYWIDRGIEYTSDPAEVKLDPRSTAKASWTVKWSCDQRGEWTVRVVLSDRPKLPEKAYGVAGPVRFRIGLF